MQVRGDNLLPNSLPVIFLFAHTNGILLNPSSFVLKTVRGIFFFFWDNGERKARKVRSTFFFKEKGSETYIDYHKIVQDRFKQEICTIKIKSANS